MVTIAPTSPVPDRVAPASMTDPVGASGGVVSGAITLAGSETLPAASACIACRISPLVCGVVSVAL
jgi:hypothetical protein